MAFKILIAQGVPFLATLAAFTSLVIASSIPHSRYKNDTSTYIATQSQYVNVFAHLSNSEDEAVRTFLSSQKKISTSMNNFIKIWSLGTLPPNKTATVAYLDGNGSQPPRYAQATLEFDCYIQEWMIGPLPVTNTTVAQPLSYMYGGDAKMEFPGCVRREPFEGLTSPEETLDWNGEMLPHDDLIAPVVVSPDGGRYEFDPEQNHISWMDFSFFAAVSRTGVGLHDIRFQGQRIAYELRMQEALAHYAGVDQLASETVYLDTMLMWKPGKLVPGFDCPSYATYTEAFCMFEYPKDFPLQRHTEGYFHVTKNIAFLVRSVVTIGNYDYQLTFEFGLDGSIQLIARASGYIAWTPWNGTPEDPDYGFNIRDGWSGAIHDHVLNFKLDLDIGGSANSLYKTEFIPYKRTAPWSNSTINTMKLGRSFVQSEDQGKIDWTPNSAATYAVVNKDTPNKYGELPGWKIYPSTGACISLTAQNSTMLGNAGNWATHQLYAVKRKDAEPTSSYAWSYYNIHQPLVDFNDYFDGESLDQEDIVLYFNLGMHHAPDTFDMPNTMFSGAQSGVTIRPQNYVNSNPSLASRQMVQVSEDGKSVDYYGQKLPTGTLDLGTTNIDLTVAMAP